MTNALKDSVARSRSRMPAPALAERIQRFTRAPCPETPLDANPRDVVLVPPKVSIERGHELARRLLDEGATAVRLVGTGAPLRGAWPSWSNTRPGLLLTEIGAYRAQSRIAVTRTLKGDIRTWLRDLLVPMDPRAPDPSRVYYGSACARLFQPLLDCHPFLEGLAEGLAGCDVRSAAPWLGQSRLDELLRLSGGRCGGPNAPNAPSAWRARALTFATAFGGAALGQLALDYAKSGLSLRRIKRASTGRHDSPRTWVTLIPTWYRMNRHVLHSVVEPALSRGRQLGVLLFGELVTGERDEQRLSSVRGRVLWGGLGDKIDWIMSTPVEQIVGPATPLELVTTIGSSVRRLAVVVPRFVLGPRYVHIAGYSVDLAKSVREASALIGLDIVRATAAERSTRRVTQSRDMHSATVIMATSGYCETSAADAVLQEAGATTVDFYHGMLGDGWPGTCESISSLRCVWTSADAEANAPSGQRSVVAGMPKPVIRPRTRPRAGHRMLIMSSYLHRDVRIDGHFPDIHAQNELLGLADALVRERPKLTVRWRPHPADSTSMVEQLCARHTSLDVSLGKPLIDDLEWCDVIVSTPSAAVWEAMFADVPIFLQAQPEWWGTPITTYFAPERVFYFADEVVPRLLACVDRLNLGLEEELDSERATRARLFGPSREPRDVLTALQGIEGVTT